jgi:hypothetical protein
VDADIDSIVLKALNREPEKRQQSAEELRAEITTTRQFTDTASVATKPKTGVRKAYASLVLGTLGWTASVVAFMFGYESVLLALLTFLFALSGLIFGCLALSGTSRVIARTGTGLCALFRALFVIGFIISFYKEYNNKPDLISDLSLTPLRRLFWRLAHATRLSYSAGLRFSSWQGFEVSEKFCQFCVSSGASNFFMYDSPKNPVPVIIALSFLFGTLE